MEFPRPEQLSKRERTNAERVSSIIHAITDRHHIHRIDDVRPQGMVRVDLAPQEYRSQSFQHDILDDKEGFDSSGNFHRNTGGRWDDMGNPHVVDL